jgi:hypothetical protein
MARKHIKQMNKQEVAFVHGFIRSANFSVWSGKAHFYDRASERSFTLADAQSAVKGGLVVEVHNDKAPDVRVLVRNQAGTCAVVSLQSREVITVYYNAPSDGHETLNWGAYRWAQDVVALVKSLRA